MQISKMAQGLVGSEIIKLAGEINKKIAQGEQIYNFTIGDFNPKFFPIPTVLKDLIIQAYEEGHTNYPAGNGIQELREAVAQFLDRRLGLSYNPEDEILIAGGARPLIYATYQTLLDPEDKVIFPVPSWNNNHYTHLAHSQKIMIEAKPENNFMPTAAEIKPYIQEATLLAVCSPLNPTGTTFSKEALQEICDLLLEENKRRSALNAKPIYLLYDQIYWTLTHGETQHYNPVSLCPELRPYTIFIDGLSKAFAATGVRVGWATAPKPILAKMKSILSHVGAWAAKAEQVATAKFLVQTEVVDNYLNHIREELQIRLEGIYKGFQSLKAKGYAVDAIAPQAAIYLTVRFDLKGKRKADGSLIETTEDITRYLLDEAKLAIVPFYAFGAPREATWYRLSVGTCDKNTMDVMLAQLEAALAKLS
jgi:aspartate aminotransferase